MFEIMFHGFGGQGAVLAATLLANTAARSGCQAQAFASYGGERRGGKVESYVRIDSEKILLHSKVYKADLLVLMDDAIAQNPQIANNLKENTTVLINTAKLAGDFTSFQGSRIVTIDANRIAARRKLTLSSGIPIINTTILGAIVALVPLLNLEHLILALHEGKMPSPEKNAAVALEAFQYISNSMDAGKTAPAIAAMAVAEITERYPVYLTWMPPCTANCPAGEDIERTAYFLQNGCFEDALGNIKIENPFPGICGRVCAHPCADHCHRREFDDGLSTNGLERAAFDHADFERLNRPTKKPDTGKKVAVIGAGPAGMTCAYYLTLLGYQVIVLESSPAAGGIPRWGIPEYRLPQKVVEGEIQEIVEMGVEIKFNTTVGKDISLRDLRQSCHACFIAIGAQSSVKLNVEGEDMDGVISGLTFLKKLRSGEKMAVGARTVVVGGGNVAVDAALSAIRVGAKEVIMVCLESREEIPADKEEINQAEEEGVRILNTWGVKQIIGSGGKAKSIELKACTAVYDKNGSFNPSYNEQLTRNLRADTVIAAVGQAPDFSLLKGTQVKFSSSIEVNPETLATNIPGVFAGGDATGLSSSVVTAVAGGKKAAINIDLYLKGADPASAQAFRESDTGALSMSRYLAGTPGSDFTGEVKYTDLHTAYFEHRAGIKVELVPVKQRIAGFVETSPGFTREEAITEAERCFHCGRCTLCENCYIFCPDLAISLSNDQEAFEINHTQCKVCGICINECPRGALSWEGEIR